MGARLVPRRRRAVHRHRDRCRDRGAARAKSLEQRVRAARGVCRSRRPATIMDGRPDGIPRPQRHARSAGRPGPRGAPLQSGRRRPRSLRRSPNPARAQSERRGRDRFSARRDGDGSGSAIAAQEIPRRRSRCRPRRRHASVGRRARHGSGDDARPRDGHSAEPLAALSDAGLPRVGACGVLSGERRLRLSRPASGRDGALRREDRMWRASICCARRRGNSSRATCSIGGCRNRGAASARASPTTASGCLMSSPTTSRSPAISACWTKSFPFSKGRRCARASVDAFFQPTVSDEQATLFEHCARALDQSLAVGSHGLPLIGTGDWNDGMNRVGEQGKGESIWLGWFLHAALIGVRATGRWPRRAGARRQAGGGTRSPWRRPSSATVGTAIGIAALISMTARRSAPPSNDECRIDSIAQSWSVISGPADPDPRRASHGGGRSTPRPRATTAWSCCSRRPSTRRRSIPAISRAIRPASGRMAASTRTAPSGR